MAGVQQPKMLFPARTVFTPYMVLHNTAKVSRAVSVNVSSYANGASTSVSVGKLTLLPGASCAVDFSAIRLPATSTGSLNLEGAFSGNEGDIETEAGSVDQTGNFVFEAEPQVEAWTNSKTVCYWATWGDTDTMVSLWNYRATAEDLTLTLYYQGGSYRLPVHLEGGEDLELDVASLIRSRKPDANGTVIPGNITEGSATLSGTGGDFDKIYVASSTSTFNVKTGTCTNQCGSCNGVTQGEVIPASILLSSFGQSAQATGQLTFNTGTVQSFTSGGNWQGGGSVATVSSSGLVTANQFGNSSASFGVDEIFYESYICTGNSFVCPSGNIGGQAPVSVTPAVPCPTMISINNNIPESLSSAFPSLRTGIGILSEMLATGPDVPYNGAQIVETITTQNNGCSKYGFSSICVASSGGQFTVGMGGQSQDGVNHLPTTDIFYDEHAEVLNFSALSAGQSCSVVCNQQYSCNNQNVGPVFTITRTLTAGTLSGTPVTFVTATKQ